MHGVSPGRLRFVTHILDLDATSEPEYLTVTSFISTYLFAALEGCRLVLYMLRICNDIYSFKSKPQADVELAWVIGMSLDV